MSSAQPVQVTPLRPQLSHLDWQTSGTDYSPVKPITLVTADAGCLLKVTHTCCKALLRDHTRQEQGAIVVSWLNKRFLASWGVVEDTAPSWKVPQGHRKGALICNASDCDTNVCFYLLQPLPQVVSIAGKQSRMCPTLSPFQFNICCHGPNPSILMGEANRTAYGLEREGRGSIFPFS